MLEGANRVDLDGNAISQIDKNEELFAKEKLKAILAARKRKALEANTQTKTTSSTITSSQL